MGLYVINNSPLSIPYYLEIPVEIIGNIIWVWLHVPGNSLTKLPCWNVFTRTYFPVPVTFTNLTIVIAFSHISTPRGGATPRQSRSPSAEPDSSSRRGRSKTVPSPDVSEGAYSSDGQTVLLPTTIIITRKKVKKRKKWLHADSIVAWIESLSW